MRHLLFLGLCALLGGCGDTIVNHYGDGGSVPGAGGELGGGGFSAVDAGDGGLGGGGDMADAGPGPADGGPMDGGGGMGAVDDPPDLDGDGLADEFDTCPLDPNNDEDKDGLCANADACPLDPANDEDGDGVCGDVDQDECPSGDRDDDRDGWPDACDVVFWSQSIRQAPGPTSWLSMRGDGTITTVEGVSVSGKRVRVAEATPLAGFWSRGGGPGIILTQTKIPGGPWEDLTTNFADREVMWFYVQATPDGNEHVVEWSLRGRELK